MAPRAADKSDKNPRFIWSRNFSRSHMQNEVSLPGSGDWNPFFPSPPLPPARWLAALVLLRPHFSHPAAASNMWEKVKVRQWQVSKQANKQTNSTSISFSPLHLTQWTRKIAARKQLRWGDARATDCFSFRLQRRYRSGPSHSIPAR